MVLDHLVLRDLQGTLPLPRTGEGYSRSLSPQLEPGTSPKQEEGLQSPHTHTHTLISRRDPQGPPPPHPHFLPLVLPREMGSFHRSQSLTQVLPPPPGKGGEKNHPKAHTSQHLHSVPAWFSSAAVPQGKDGLWRHSCSDLGKPQTVPSLLLSPAGSSQPRLSLALCSWVG
jgi:hypothetical protein